MTAHTENAPASPEGDPMRQQRVHVTRTETDAQGNAGMMHAWGSYDTVDEAKANAEARGIAYHPGAAFHWKQFSPTTWGLMNGQRYTNILVSDVTAFQKD